MATLLFSLAGVAYASDHAPLPQRAWHTSTSGDPRSSTIYPVIEWKIVESLRIGMPQAQAEALIGLPLQFYHHPVNAIVYSKTAQGRMVEVALKRAADGSIEDISFKPR